MFSKISAVMYAWIMEPKTVPSVQIQAIFIPSSDNIAEKHFFFFLEFHVIN